MPDTKLPEAVARLQAFHANLPEKSFFGIEERLVAEFHAILKLLKDSAGVDVANFHLAETDLQPVLRSSNSLTGTKDYSCGRYANTTLVRIKAEGALRFAEMLLSKEEKIGFKT